MWTADASPTDRIKAAAGAILLQLVIGYALVTGLAVRMPAVTEDSLALFGIAPERPPPPPRSIPP